MYIYEYSHFSIDLSVITLAQEKNYLSASPTLNIAHSSTLSILSQAP